MRLLCAHYQGPALGVVQLLLAADCWTQREDTSTFPIIILFFLIIIPSSISETKATHGTSSEGDLATSQSSLISLVPVAVKTEEQEAVQYNGHPNLFSLWLCTPPPLPPHLPARKLSVLHRQPPIGRVQERKMKIMLRCSSSLRK